MSEQGKCLNCGGVFKAHTPDGLCQVMSLYGVGPLNACWRPPGQGMTAEEAHIKARLEYGEYAYIRMETDNDDDFHLTYSIVENGEYEGYITYGEGDSWEAAFADAEAARAKEKP